MHVLSRRVLTRACPRLNGRLALVGVSLVGCGGRGRRLADWVQARQRLDFGRRDESAFQRAAALGETRTDDALGRGRCPNQDGQALGLRPGSWEAERPVAAHDPASGTALKGFTCACAEPIRVAYGLVFPCVTP